MNLIQIRQNERLLVLHGPGAAAPFRGAIYCPDAASQDERARSEIELALEGTPAQIEAGLARLGSLLEEAQRWASVPGGEHVYIEARVTPGGTLWRSRLTGGRILLAESAGSRALGRQAARLALERFDWWEGPETELPLSSPTRTGVTGGLEISNCWDAARANYAEIAADALAQHEAGDLPAPLILDFEGIDTDYTGTLYAFQNIYSSPTELAPILEGEAGQPGGEASGVEISDPAASGGRYLRLGWSGEEELTAWSGALPAQMVRQCAGRPFLPVMRLARALYASEKVWHYWRLTIAWSWPETVLDGPGCYLPVAAVLAPGVPVFLPPWPVGPEDTPAGLGLELRAQAAGAGSHQLDLDTLYLLPLDGWRIYRPAITSWGGGLRVHDDPIQGTLRSGGWGIQMHTAEGPGLWLHPGRAARVYFLVERAGGGFSNSTRSRVRLFCRPRRKAL